MEEAEAVEFSPSYRILEATDESEDDLHHSSGRTKQEPKSSGKQTRFTSDNQQQELELEEESFFEQSKKKQQSGGKQFDEYGHASYNMSFSSSPNPAIPRPTKFSDVGEQYNQQLQSPVEEELPRVNMKIERIDQYNYQLKGKNLMSSFEDATYSNQIQHSQQGNLQQQQQNSSKSEVNRNSFNKQNQQYQQQQKKQLEQQYSPDKDSQDDDTSQRKLSVEPMKLIDQEGMLGKNTLNSSTTNTVQTDIRQNHLGSQRVQQDVYQSENDNKIQNKSVQNKNNSGQVLNDQVKQIISKRNAAEQQQQSQQQFKNMSFMQKSDYSSEWGYQRDEELKEQQKQIGELEQALRIETLNFEEAKRCIQILRNALSQKLEDMTIKKLIEDTAAKAKINKVDLYTFISSQSRNGNGEDEKDKVSAKQLKLMKEQMARIEEFNDSLSVDLKNAIYALQIAEDEKAAALQAQKLAMFEQNSHEKDQLLDYLTDYKKQIDSLQQETLLLREQIDISHGSRRNNQENNEIHNDIQEKNVLLDDENADKDDQEHKSHESSFNDHSIVQQRTLETNVVKTENTGLITRLLNEVKEAIEKGKGGQNLAQKHQRLVDVTSKLIVEAQHLDDLTKELKNLLENERQQHLNEMKDTFNELTAEREENRQNKEQYSQLELEHESVLEQIEQYKEVIQEKQEALEKSNEEVLKIRELISDKENEICELKEQVDSNQKNIEDLNVIIQEYLDQIDQLKQQLNASSSPSQKQIKQNILDPSLGIQQLHEQDQFMEIIKKQKMDQELLEAQTRLSNLEGQVEEMENEIQIKQSELTKQEELRLTTQEAYETQIEEFKSLLEEKDRRIQSQNESYKKEIEQLTKGQTDVANQRQKERNQLTEEVKRMLSQQLESQKDIWSSLCSILPNSQTKNAVSDLIEVQIQISQLDIQKSLNNLALNSLELQTADSSHQSLNHILNTQIQALKHTLLLLDESKAPLISRKLALINVTHQQSNQVQISAEMVSNLQEDLADARENLQRLTKEMELKHISAKSVQNAYNDLLQEYGRLLSQSLQNAPGKSVILKQQQYTAAPFSASKSPQKLTLSCNLSSGKILQPAQPDQSQLDSMGLRFPKRQLDTLPLNSRYESSHFSLNEHSNSQTVRVSKDLSPQNQ